MPNLIEVLPPNPRLSIASSYHTVPITPTQDLSVLSPRLSRASSYYTAFPGHSPTSPTAPNVHDSEDPDFPESVLVDVDVDASSFSSSSTTLRHQGPPSGSSSSTTLDDPLPSPPASVQFEPREYGTYQQFMPNANRFMARDFFFNNIQVHPGGNVNITNMYCPHGQPWTPRRSTF